MHKLAQAVLTYIRRLDLLRPGDRVGIAVSGGADSVALLRLMLELRQEIGLVLSVVHLNHKLRGAESDADEAFVCELAKNHGLELISESRDVKAYTVERKLGVEAAARDLRYEFFRRALQCGLDRIATAHTADDQAETMLLKLARGAGTRGLAGIYPKISIQHSTLGAQPKAPSLVPSASSEQAKDGHWSLAVARSHQAVQWTDKSIVRPLLGLRRGELRAYLAEIGQTWREDSGNRDLRHTRNRIRHGILPRFEKHVNPHVRETLAEAAEIARGEEEYWAEEIAQLLSQVWYDDGTLSSTKLAAFPLALRRRLVRAVGEALGLALEFRHVEEVLRLEAEGRASLPSSWLATRRGDGIKFHQQSTDFSDYKYVLSVPGKVAVPELRLRLEAVLVSGVEKSEDLLESSFSHRGLVVRNWRAGERFWPMHTKEPKKIKELLQDRHVTGDEKRRWPVIASGNEVVWMRGFGVRRDFQAKDNQGVLIREL